LPRACPTNRHVLGVFAERRHNGFFVRSRSFVHRPSGSGRTRCRMALFMESGRPWSLGDYVPVHRHKPLYRHEARLCGDDPPPLPNDLWVIYLTGLFEIAGAVGLLIPRTRRLAGICLALLLVALFPANVYAALSEIPLRGEAATPLWIRTPMQLLYIGMVWWTSVKAHPTEVGPPRVKDPVVGHDRASREGATS
jgi:uncharacterized membrane protein